MVYPPLYVFVEGSDDSDFFSQIFKKHFKRKYRTKIVRIITYKRQLTDELLKKYIQTARDQKAPIIFTADFDTGPCITNKRRELMTKYDLKKEEVLIVKKSIESWYISGSSLSKSSLDHNSIGKKEFNLFSDRYLSIKDAKIKLLEKFDPNLAAQRNSSFGRIWVLLK